MDYVTLLRDKGYIQADDAVYVTSAVRIDRMPFDMSDAVLIRAITAETWPRVTEVVISRLGKARRRVWLGVASHAEPSGQEELLWIPEDETTDVTAMVKQTEYSWSLVVLPIQKEEDTPFTLAPLRDVVAALRAPDGCPWDRLQTHSTLRRYLLEEIYEVLEAIDNEDVDNLREELGDVLLQIVFHARLAEEAGQFSLQDVINDITTKMIRRHPHVFNRTDSEGAATAVLSWEALKAQERGHERRGLLDGVSKGLPALLRAQKLQEKAAKVGFDWDSVEPVWNKFYEEIDEFKEAVAVGDRKNAELEAGDVLFSLINLLRWYKIGGENALNRTNTKFYRRFSYVEHCVRSSNTSWDELTLAELDSYWDAAKVNERSHSV